MKIKEYRSWSVVDVRTMCIRRDLFTRGNNEEYSELFVMVQRLEPTLENMYKVASYIAEHSFMVTAAHLFDSQNRTRRSAALPQT